MPKLQDTRKQKAVELFRLAQGGPGIFPNIKNPDNYGIITKEQYETDYRIWSQSWLLPLLEELVPEIAQAMKVAPEADREQARKSGKLSGIIYPQKKGG